MKILTAAQVYQADKFTIEKQQISSDALMERAAVQIFEWIHARLQGAPVLIHIFCGIGNNGGDGIALARHLAEHGYNIKVYVVNYSEKRSKDFLLNMERLKDRKIWPEFINAETTFPEIQPNDIIVDAIFGIGLNRCPDNWVCKLIEHLNASKAFTLSVDIPSGLPVDQPLWDEAKVVYANYVLSFQTPKLVFFLPQSGIYLENWEVLDIGLDAEFMMNVPTTFEFLQKHDMQGLYIPREKFSHKGTYGHAMIVGGSYGKIGAVHLSGKGCLRSGAGLVTLYVPECGYDALQSSFPEAMVITDEEEDYISKISFSLKPSSVGIGMGMGTDEETAKAFGNFLKSIEGPLVIDADGINILAKHPEMLKDMPKESILTPHPKELERLIGTWKNDFEKLEKATRFSSTYKCILVIKGAHTIVISGEKGFVNNTGNPGMATAGSGDVLTGIITGLLAQKYPSLHAAIFGVYLHGLSADIQVSRTGFEALIASDMIENVGNAFVELFRREEPNAKQES
ncbi:NAD(P)H-hydrate dehydratase [Flagellimonas sp.]|uniref:NAD(P)H-hydrate dehydratase n=1 Tax=Flagellimonas sp. TaxID=2058762 RepID=UPI003F49F48C